MSACVVLVRHGETEWNRQRRNQGRFDSPLTERGIAQAHAIGRLLAVLPNAAAARIVASPLGRARRTAEIICEHLDPAPELGLDDRLRELSIGSWDGLTYSEIAMCAPGIFDGDGRSEWCFRSPDGERYEGFAARVADWLSAPVDAPLTIVVTHGMVSRVLRGLYARLPRDAALILPVPQDKVFRLSNGAIEEIPVGGKMARYRDITLAEMTPAQRRVHDLIVSGRRGRFGGPFQLLIRAPEICEHAAKLGEHLRWGTSLPDRLSELAIITTAQFWRAQYEWYAHAPLAEQAGVPAAAIEAIRHEETPSFDQQDEALVYRVCTELFKTRRLSDATFNEAVTTLGETGLTEVIAIIGYYTLIGNTLNVFQVAVPEGTTPPFPE